MKQDIGEAYAEHAKTVYRYLYCLCKDTALAEDLMQETFCRAAEQIDSFRGECKLSVWLCQIAKFLWYEELRRKKPSSLDDEEEAEPPAPVHVENEVLYNEDKLTLYRQLHGLDEVTREVMYLRLTGELSFREIGDILGRSEAWARVTFYRGKQKLGKGDWNA